MSHKHPHPSKPSKLKQVAQRLTAWTHRHYRDQGSADLRSLGHLLVDLRASVPLRDVPRGEVLSVCLSVACIRLCREERYCPSEGLCGVLVWNCGVFRSGGCGLSTRPHRPHELSSIPNGLVFLSDCSLTAVCADARLCEQLLPATATLQDLTHCPERSATGCLRHYAGRARRGKDTDDLPQQPEQERRFRRRPMCCLLSLFCGSAT